MDNNITFTPFQRVRGYIESRAETIADRITSVTSRTFDFIVESLVTKIDTFLESHPRTIQTLEPAICSLLRLIQNYPILFILPAVIGTSMVVTASILMTSSFLEYLALSEIIIEIAIVTITIINIAFLVPCLLLGIIVPNELVKKHLEQSLDINKLTETFLKLDPEFVTVLNEWSRNESREVDSQWREARKNIINFYNSDYDTTLSLEHFNLHSLPDIFDKPNFRNKLERLHLYDNHLTRLPESIGNLQILTRLNLADNPELAGLPSAILQLPPTCTVDITNCNFSAAVLERIREIINDPEYIGPQISHSMRNLSHQFEREPSIEQSLKKFYRISGKNYNGLPKLNRLPNLRSWLHKLTWVADFKGNSQRAFVTKIIEYLESANKNDAFREVFAATILDATESCGDRVALSILNLGVAYKLSSIDLQNMHELYHLLIRGVLALDLLQDIARQKIPTLRMFDEIEVYLGYPVKLKEDLNLPIDIEDMLYFGCSALSPQDLEDAKNSVLNSLKNEDMQIAFLKAEPKWIDALRINYPEAMERIGQNADTADQELINLIRNIIQSFNS